MAPKVCRKTSEDHFLGVTPQKRSAKVARQLFWQVWVKFGQKSFATPRICLLLHLCVKRSTMGQQRLGTLVLLCIESNLLKKLT